MPKEMTMHDTLRSLYLTVLKDKGATVGFYYLEPFGSEDGYQISTDDVAIIKADIVETELGERMFMDISLALREACVKRDLDDKDTFIGYWLDDKGDLYIDLSMWHRDRNTAIMLGHEYQQKAIYDWAKKEAITIHE